VGAPASLVLCVSLTPICHEVDFVDEVEGDKDELRRFPGRRGGAGVGKVDFVDGADTVDGVDGAGCPPSPYSPLCPPLSRSWISRHHCATSSAVEHLRSMSAYLHGASRFQRGRLRWRRKSS